MKIKESDWIYFTIENEYDLINSFSIKSPVKKIILKQDYRYYKKKNKLQKRFLTKKWDFVDIEYQKCINKKLKLKINEINKDKIRNEKINLIVDEKNIVNKNIFKYYFGVIKKIFLSLSK